MLEKMEFHRVEVFDDGKERLGLITLKRIPKQETIRIMQGDKELFASSFSVLGMPILEGETLEEYLADSTCAELKVSYQEEDEKQWKICGNARDVQRFLKKASLKELAVNHMKYEHNNSGKIWIPGAEDLLIWGKYVLTPFGAFLHLEKVAFYPEADYVNKEVVRLNLTQNDSRGPIRLLRMETSLRSYKCPICRQHFSLKDRLTWNFELTKMGPVHKGCIDC